MKPQNARTPVKSRRKDRIVRTEVAGRAARRGRRARGAALVWSCVEINQLILRIIARPLREPARHRADAGMAATSRRWRGICGVPSASVEGQNARPQSASAELREAHAVLRRAAEDASAVASPTRMTESRLRSVGEHFRRGQERARIKGKAIADASSARRTR